MTDPKTYIAPAEEKMELAVEYLTSEPEKQTLKFWTLSAWTTMAVPLLSQTWLTFPCRTLALSLSHPGKNPCSKKLKRLS